MIHHNDIPFPIQKLVIFSHDSRVGGASINLLRLIETFKCIYGIKHVHTLTLFKGDLHAAFENFGEVTNINAGFNDIATIEAKAEPVIQQLHAKNYTYVIANTVISGALTRLFKKYGMTVVSLIHELPTLIKAMSLAKYAENIVRYSDCIVFSCRYVRDAFPNIGMANPHKFKILEQGIRTYHYNGTRTEARRALRKKFQLPENAKIIFGCGVGEARKGLDLLPQIMRTVVSEVPNAYFLWLGDTYDPTYRAWLDHDINKLGLQDRIIFCSDFIPQPSLFFCGADVFLLCSREDPFPSVVPEAMMIGVPCVSFEDSGGTEEMLQNGRGGLHPYLDIAAMSNDLVRILLSSEQDLASMTHAAHAYVQSFTYERYAAELLALLLYPIEQAAFPLDGPSLLSVRQAGLTVHCMHTFNAASTASDKNSVVFTASIPQHANLDGALPTAIFPQGTPFVVILDRMASLLPRKVYIHDEGGKPSLWSSHMRLAAHLLQIPCAGITSDGEIVSMPDAAFLSTSEQRPSEIPSPWPFQTLLVAIHAYELGGGEIVAQRTANEMSRHCRVLMYNARPQLEDKAFFDNLSPQVTLLPSRGEPLELRRYVEILEPDVINSHVWWSEIVVYQAIHDIPVTWILTTHGCHETLLAVPECDVRHAKYGVKVLSRANRVVYVAEKNRTILEKFPSIGADKYVKMINGCVLPPFTPRARQELGILPEDVVFCLVSRAIPEKGWEEGIQATLKIQLPASRRAHIILVGDGEMKIPLQEKYIGCSNVHFVGLSSAPMEWMSISDIGLLPTYYIVESQPLVIGEFITMGIPVIATDVGDIPCLLDMDGIKTGIICPLAPDKKISVADLAAAMQRLASDKSLYSQMQQNTLRVAPKFSITASCATAFSRIPLPH